MGIDFIIISNKYGNLKLEYNNNIWQTKARILKNVIGPWNNQ